MLLGRSSECGTLDGLLEGVRAGRSGALVVRGEPGVGKSALLEYVVERASGCRVARAAGVQSEMELAFAGLHQLCAPMLDRLGRVPGPQREALGVVFGLEAGTAPDRFLVGLAVLGLLSEAAAERPLVCVVDDAQWLDRASAQALGFVARRLVAESVAIVFAARESGGEPAGLPELIVEGLAADDARALLASVIQGPLDARVRDRIVAETRGNPLALLELPRGVSSAELAGGFGLPDASALPGRIEEAFRRRLEALPEDTRRLMLVAAAEPVGDPVLVWRAAERLGIGGEAATPAAAAGLLELGAGVRFRHPLVRSAAYRAASLQQRRRVHGALAEATDPERDPDRRAWHRAHAAPGPDEAVAEELVRSAGRAQARGGLAAAAAFLERAAGLTLDPGRRAERALAAAQAKHLVGAPRAALGLLATARAGPLDALRRAQVDLLHGHIAFASRRGGEAPRLLLSAARRFEPLDAGLARGSYLDALTAALFVGRLAGGRGVPKVAEAARAAAWAGSAPPPSRAPELLLVGLAALFTDGYAAGTPALKRALSAFRTADIPREEGLRWFWLACHAAADLWDDDAWRVLSARFVQLARDAGALAVLPIALNSHIMLHLFGGQLGVAASLVEEAEAVTDATRSQLIPYGALALAAFRGREADAAELIEATLREVMRRGEGIGLNITHWASAVLYNGAGRHAEALAAAERAAEYPEELLCANWALPELIEAAARSGLPDRAAGALRRLSETTRAGGSDWALGIQARSLALLSDDDVAEKLYREAIERLACTRVRVELARAHLLYGEWLRGENRRLDAREQLRSAHAMLAAMGLEAFAERAARELLATGETARRRTVASSDRLTAQEAQIARLARDGLANAEIATRLFLSPRTVEYHLTKVFAKLDIRSRHQLHHVLGGDTGATQPA